MNFREAVTILTVTLNLFAVLALLGKQKLSKFPEYSNIYY